MKKVLLLILSCISSNHAQSQKYSPTQLQADLAFLKQQITNVHAAPYSEFTADQYTRLFNNISNQLKDSATAADFLKLVKPVIAHLSDEHANIGFDKKQLPAPYNNAPVYLPFTLTKTAKGYAIDTVLANNTHTLSGTTITHINNIPITTCISRCALTISGMPSQRSAKVLPQFGYLFPWTTSQTTTSFTLRTAAGKTLTIPGTTLQVWENYFNHQTNTTPCDERIYYQHNGSTGYINACSFDVKNEGYTLDSIQRKIDGLFKQVLTDSIQQLIIDVSNNEGGNSAVGEYLISCFYTQPYRDYQCNWKRSDEYLKLLTSWGFHDSAYAAAHVGTTLHFPSSTINPLTVPYRFKGKVYIVIGAGTFSSAILFATNIKDNHIAPLIGQQPINGHPNHFGEMYNTWLPNTRIALRFGVKEWIRPAGKGSDNILKPDIPLTDSQLHNLAEMTKTIKTHPASSF